MGVNCFTDLFPQEVFNSYDFNKEYERKNKMKILPSNRSLQQYGNQQYGNNQDKNKREIKKITPKYEKRQILNPLNTVN